MSLWGNCVVVAHVRTRAGDFENELGGVLEGLDLATERAGKVVEHDRAVARAVPDGPEVGGVAALLEQQQVREHGEEGGRRLVDGAHHGRAASRDVLHGLHDPLGAERIQT